MFRKIFCCEFNIEFCSPSSDVCGYCTLLDNKINAASPSQKQRLFTEKRILKKRAKCFYDALSKPAEFNESKVCFDMQQVQPLPHTPIQQVFYSSQLGLYNVCLMSINDRTTPSFFTSLFEEQAVFTEIASVILAYLKSQDLTNKQKISFFSDGCIGQNKNNHKLHAMMFFLATHVGSVDLILLTFSVGGSLCAYSFLPADRVFGQAEKHLRKNPTIIDKSKYYEQYEKVGTVHKLGHDWELFDVKSLGKVLKNHISAILNESL